MTEETIKIVIEQIKYNMNKHGITLQQIIDVRNGELENLAKIAGMSVEELKKQLV